MKKLLKKLSDALPTILLVLGAAAVSAGVALIYLPAGIITAGALLITGGILTTLGGGGNSE